jgi:hypothetical protein
MVPVDVDPTPERLIAAPGLTTGVGVVRVATGVLWMDTVTVEGALTWPRLSVTTSWNVTDPDVLGTVTETLELVVEIEGLLGDNGVGAGIATMGVVTIGVVATGVVATGAVAIGAAPMVVVAMGSAVTPSAAAGTAVIGGLGGVAIFSFPCWSAISAWRL